MYLHNTVVPAVVHRDLKRWSFLTFKTERRLIANHFVFNSENVLLHNGTAKLADFQTVRQVAQQTGQTQDDKDAAPGMVTQLPVGTPVYMVSGQKRHPGHQPHSVKPIKLSRS